MMTARCCRFDSGNAFGAELGRSKANQTRGGFHSTGSLGVGRTAVTTPCGVQVEMQVEVGCWWSGLTADQGMHRPRSQPRGLEERSPRVRLAGQRVRRTCGRGPGVCVGLVPGERAPESYPGRVGRGSLRGLGPQASAGARGWGPGWGGWPCGPSAAVGRSRP